jgi:predicted ribosomally synthesized peptide with nif11-like leader
MSVEHARKFLDRVNEDAQVRESAQAAYAEELLRLANRLGFHMSGEDLKEAIRDDGRRMMETRSFLPTTGCYRIAEIGVGNGETSLAFAQHLAGSGVLHLFDRQTKVDAVAAMLGSKGFTNVRAYGCSDRLLDSYNWSLAKLLREHREPIFDYVFLDGAHTWAHDALAFFLLDRLLVPGGYLDFDDYDWTIASSPTTNPQRVPAMNSLYTEEQMRTKQIKMVVDFLVRRTPGYVEVHENKIFQKITA